jgi:hypothetical protein
LGPNEGTIYEALGEVEDAPVLEIKGQGVKDIIQYALLSSLLKTSVAGLVG